MTEKDVNKNCDCGYDHENEAEDFITLEFDDGEEVECSIIGVFEANGGKEYIALVPDDDSGDVYIYGYKEIDDETFDLVDIEDEEEFKLAVEEFDKIVEENAEE